MDLNAPLAGKDLNFKGSVVASREATNDEIQAMINRMSGEGCGCGCDDCEGGCGDHHHDEDCGCGCGCH
jgi:FKBP-type peptidyl-prolyl cis-trans isomerase SlyD